MDWHQETASWADARDARIDLRGPDRTVNRLLISASAAFSDSIALTDGVPSVTYAELPECSGRQTRRPSGRCLDESARGSRDLPRLLMARCDIRPT